MAMLALMPAAAMAAGKSDVLAVAQQWADSFNEGGFATRNAPCADDAAVIDDFPPHVWKGSGPCTAWFVAFRAYAVESAITDAKITLGKTQHLDVESGYAYLIATVAVSFRKNGMPVNDTGIITMSLRDSGAGWRITGLAWADQ
jgi:hypothetical protein